MWKKFVVIAGLSAAALGVGGVAAADAASSATTAPAAAVAPSSSSGASTAPKAAHTAHKGDKRDKAEKVLGRVSHAQWVSKDKDGKFVTHDAVRGSVTAVSSTSITVKAADSTTETYALNSTTKVHAKGDTKAHPGTIAQVKVGDEVGVLGTGSGTMTATHVLDRGVPKK